LAARVNGFRGSVFVVEDEPLILLELQQMLSELGWEVVHLASDIDSATEIARSTEFDLGILDVNVKGRTSSSVAEILRTKHVPVIVATGYYIENVIENYPGVIFLQKPYMTTDLENALARAVAHRQKSLIKGGRPSVEPA